MKKHLRKSTFQTNTVSFSWKVLSKIEKVSHLTKILSQMLSVYWRCSRRHWRFCHWRYFFLSDGISFQVTVFVWNWLVTAFSRVSSEKNTVTMKNRGGTSKFDVQGFQHIYMFADRMWDTVTVFFYICDGIFVSKSRNIDGSGKHKNTVAFPKKWRYFCRGKFDNIFNEKETVFFNLCWFSHVFFNIFIAIDGIMWNTGTV